MTDPNDGDYRPDDELDRQAWEDQQWEPPEDVWWQHEMHEPDDDHWDAPVVEKVQLPGNWTSWTTK